MKKIISKKNKCAVRRILCMLLIVAMLSPALSVGAETTEVNVTNQEAGTVAAEDDKTDTESGTTTSEEDITDTTESKDTTGSDNEVAESEKEGSVSDNDTTAFEEDSTVSDNDVTASEEDTTVSDNEVSVSENDATVSDNDVNKAPTDVGTGGGLAAPQITLYVKQGTVAGPDDLTEADELKDGTEISLNSPLYMKLVWGALTGVTYGTPYEYDLPAALGNPGNAHNGSVQLEDILDQDGNPIENGITIASWAVNPTSQKISITFHEKTFYLKDADDNLVEMTTADATDVTFFFACNLYDDNLAPDPNGKITISLPGGKQINVIVTEKKPTEPKLTKASKVVDDGGRWAVEWTVTYQAPGANYKGDVPSKLTDALPIGLEYVDNTFECTWENPGSEPAPITLSEKTAATDTEGQKLIFGINKDTLTPGKLYTLTYTTRLTDEKLFELWKITNPKNQTFTNRIAGLKDDDTEISNLNASSGAVLNKDWEGLHLLDKAGALTIENGKYYLDWTVTVNTAGNNFVYLKVIDTLGKSLTLDVSTLVVVNDAEEWCLCYNTGTGSGR